MRLPGGLRAPALASARSLGERLGPLHRWLVVGSIIGTGPLLFDYATGWPASRLTVAVLLTPLLVAAVARDSLGRAFAAIGAAFVAHSWLFMTLAAHDAGGLATSFPDGEAYWKQSRSWITTGVCQEYDVTWWLPAHFQLLGVMALFSYVSLGFVTFWQGLYEVDLMNFYVGQLMAHSRSPWLACALGWHVWSLCRAIGYGILTFEVTSFSFERLTGARLSTPFRRGSRWLAGLAFLGLDALLKFSLLESVREMLAANLS